MQGWISIHRSIIDNWIYPNKRKFSPFEAWIHVLLTVNHKPANVRIRGRKFVIDSGQSVKSIHTWAKEFGWTKSATYRFFLNLQDDKMIELINEQTTTRLIVLNYDKYQNISDKEPEQQIEKPKRESHTEKINQFPFKNELIGAGADPEDVETFLIIRKKKKGVNSKQAFEALKRETQKAGITVKEAVHLCAENSWISFRAFYLSGTGSIKTKQSHVNSGDSTDWDREILTKNQ